jgi:hypothetical protein
MAMYNLTDEEIYMICNALNESAADLEKLAKAQRNKGHTYQQITVLEQCAKTERSLTKKLLDMKVEREMA